jgi:hypothetical protein
MSRASAIPPARPGSPGEVATVVCFLASPRLGLVTGEVLRTDGGPLAGASAVSSDQAVQHSGTYATKGEP